MLKRLTLSPDSGGETAGEAEPSPEDSETRLRRSLEMLGSGPRRDGVDHASKPASYSPAGARRHRFKDDGEVPVVHVAPHRERGPGGSPVPGRIANQVDGQASEERASRERAERALEAARETIRHLQTRLGHDELALREALAQAQASEQATAALRQELEFHRGQLAEAAGAAEQADHARRTSSEDLERHRQALKAAEAELAALRGSQGVAKAWPARVAKLAGPAKPKRQPKASGPVEKEPEPVKWWLTSQKAVGSKYRRSKN